MIKSKPPVNVGAMDPELRNSPVIEDTDEDYALAGQEQTVTKTCFFNGTAFPNGQSVCSGSGEMLRCVDGKWIRVGSCDSDNP